MAVARSRSYMRCTFWRGGTSKGLIFLASRLAPFSQEAREAIICSAMGSPDPDGRQIDGLGGGVSSLSKVAIINYPGRGGVSQAKMLGIPFPGVPWSENYRQASDHVYGWDLVYRFGQVPIRGTKIDWGSTCGNFVAAVAQHAIATVTVDYRLMARRAAEANVDANDPNARFMCPLRILQAESGNLVLASVAVSQVDGRWLPDTTGDASIAGVPGTHASTVIETPLGKRTLLPTSNRKDFVIFEGNTVEVSIIDAGLPVIFVRAADIGIHFEQLTSHPASLDADASLLRRIEAFRRQVSAICSSMSAYYFPGSAAPKVCLLHPRASYQSTGDRAVPGEQMDCLARAISVGQFHRTIPATTLSAIGVGSALRNTVVSDVIGIGGASVKNVPPDWARATNPGAADRLRSVRVGQPAGISSTCLRMSSGPSPVPESILMERTARMIMNGGIAIPKHLEVRKFKSFIQDFDKFSSKRKSLEYDDWEEDAEDQQAISRTNHRKKTVSPVFSRSRPWSAHQMRRYVSQARQSARKRGDDATARLHVYRHLTRGILRHVTLTTPARYNLKRLVREDFTAAMTSVSLEALQQRAEATLYLLLSASERNAFSSREADIVRSQPKSPTTSHQPNPPPALPLARRLLQNIGSLIYHHLSPNTVMRSLHRPRLIGGSQSSAARHNRAVLSEPPSSAETMATTLLLKGFSVQGSPGPDGALGGQNQWDSSHAPTRQISMGSQRLLAPLTTVARPARGPITGRASGSILAAEERFFPWDGQRAARNFERAQSRQEGNLLKQKLDDLTRQLENPTIKHKEREAKTKERIGIRGILKGLRKREKSVREARRVRDEARNLLFQVIKGAELTSGGIGIGIGGGARNQEEVESQQDQLNNGPFFGASTRWKKWLDGRFLPP